MLAILLRSGKNQKAEIEYSKALGSSIWKTPNGNIWAVFQKEPDKNSISINAKKMEIPIIPDDWTEISVHPVIKLRRKVEDTLRKTSFENIVFVAYFLGLDLDFKVAGNWKSFKQYGDLTNETEVIWVDVLDLTTKTMQELSFDSSADMFEYLRNNNIQYIGSDKIWNELKGIPEAKVKVRKVTF